MKWVAFLVKAVVIFFVLWLVFIYGYGDFWLADTIVPDADIEIDEWLHIILPAALLRLSD